MRTIKSPEPAEFLPHICYNPQKQLVRTWRSVNDTSGHAPDAPDFQLSRWLGPILRPAERAC